MPAKSRAKEAGFIATTISCRPRRARKPSLLTRMVYQVGCPWMLDGKRFLPDTGMPILNKARRIVVLAVELPEPLTVPTVIEKSLMILFSISVPIPFQAIRHTRDSADRPVRQQID